MATIPRTNQSSSSGQWSRFLWDGLAASGDVGAAVEVGQGDRSVQVTGAFSGSAACGFEGSNDDGVTWFTLNDYAGAAISFTAAGGSGVREVAQMVRPKLTAGSGGASIKAYLFATGG